MHACRRSGVYGGVHTAPIVTMLVMGHLLLTLGQDGQLAAWKIGSYSKPEAVTQLPEGFVPTCLAHPDTYLNKVMVVVSDTCTTYTYIPYTVHTYQYYLTHARWVASLCQGCINLNKVTAPVQLVHVLGCMPASLCASTLPPAPSHLHC